MKRFIKLSILAVIFSAALMQSCTDKDYDWDNIDKNGVLNIPPVMFGNIDTIYLEGLPEVDLPGGIPIPNFSITRKEVIENILDGDAIDDFFYDGAGDVEISGKADIDLEISGLTIDLYFNVTDSNGDIIPSVVIPKQTLTTGKNQKISIKVASQYMKYMENTKDLVITIVLSSNNGSVWIGDDDYIFIKEAIVTTGGFHFEL